jgi:hypothetical protein
LGVVALGGGAMAQSLAPPTFDDDAWRFAITPYLFLPVTTTGDATVAGVTADVDLDLGDVFDLLNSAASGRAEAWRGDLGLIVEGYFVRIGGDDSLERRFGSLGVDVQVDQIFVDLLGAWRAVDGT